MVAEVEKALRQRISWSQSPSKPQRISQLGCYPRSHFDSHIFHFDFHVSHFDFPISYFDFDISHFDVPISYFDQCVKVPKMLNTNTDSFSEPNFFRY